MMGKKKKKNPDEKLLSKSYLIKNKIALDVR